MTDGIKAAERIIDRDIEEYTDYVESGDLWEDARIVAKALLAAPTDAERVKRDSEELWSFLRDVLARGAAIQLDYSCGHHGSYEMYSARMDAAARELASLAAQWPGRGEKP